MSLPSGISESSTTDKIDSESSAFPDFYCDFDKVFDVIVIFR